jgi:hypothetical protein
MANIYRVAYAVSDGENDDQGKKSSRWSRIGVSFLNKDDSETVFLDALPINGKIILRKPKDNPADSSEEK